MLKVTVVTSAQTFKFAPCLWGAFALKEAYEFKDFAYICIKHFTPKQTGGRNTVCFLNGDRHTVSIDSLKLLVAKTPKLLTRNNCLLRITSFQGDSDNYVTVALGRVPYANRFPFRFPA